MKPVKAWAVVDKKTDKLKYYSASLRGYAVYSKYELKDCRLGIFKDTEKLVRVEIREVKK
jgi:hypothetical protein